MALIPIMPAPLWQQDINTSVSAIDVCIRFDAAFKNTVAARGIFRAYQFAYTRSVDDFTINITPANTAIFSRPSYAAHGRMLARADGCNISIVYKLENYNKHRNRRAVILFFLTYLAIIATVCYAPLPLWASLATIALVAVHALLMLRILKRGVVNSIHRITSAITRIIDTIPQS